MKRTLRQLVILATGAALVMTASFTYPIASALGADDISGLRSQIDSITQDVAVKKEQQQQLNSRIGEYTKKVLEKKAESAVLEDEMSLLDSRISRTQLSIDIAKQEIGGLEVEIKALDANIADQEVHMGRQRVLLGAVARKLYQARSGRSTFEILMAHDSFSEFFDTMRSIASLQSGVNDALKTLVGVRTQLAEQKENREAKRQALLDKRRELETAKNDIEDERALKDAILAETQSSELRYRYLLADLKREQSEADSEIAYLERVLREKVETSDRLQGGDTVLSWPVEPSRGLSALFHDPEYPFRNVFEHPAVDIRAYQGTPVRASAAGIVARAKNAGMGYSYIMLLHNNDISTVYGHISRIVAKEDTFVERGEIIGYSGGMPGTPGAGRLTTGPHLHFEVRLNGIPVNPLNYLVNY